MNKWSFVLFDMDGTLIDSAQMVTRRFANTFKAFGIPVPSDEELHSFVGPSAATTMSRYFPSDKANQALAHYRILAKEDGVSGLELFGGIAQLLESLSQRGVEMGIATSKPETEAIQILQHLKIIQYFSVISGASDLLGIHLKSDVIRKAIDNYSVDSLNKMVMVGDRIFDIEGAMECGIDSIFVTWGGAPVGEGEKASAVVNSSVELLSLISPSSDFANH